MTDTLAMRVFFFFALFSSDLWSFTNEQTISGRVNAQEGCSKKVMVWLSLDKENYQERLLLMHTEVPVKGSFQFYVKPGDYQIRVSDEAGCEFSKKISIRNEDVQVDAMLVKK